MPSDTITVRFDKHLYDRVKSHWMPTSDLVRDAVRTYLDELDEEETQYLGNPHESTVKSDAQQVRSYCIHDVNAGAYGKLDDMYAPVYEQKNVDTFHPLGHSGLVDDTDSLMNKLKNEIDELDGDLEDLMNRYKDVRWK